MKEMSALKVNKVTFVSAHGQGLYRLGGAVQARRGQGYGRGEG